MELIDKKYKVIRPLGGGGFSEVYLVVGSKGPCALKLLKGNLVSLKKGALDEFRHEFEILKDMRHPNIAGILDFGFDADEGRYYYTSEFIEGVDFNKATEGMAVENVTGLVVEALRALEYLHSYRIHHFDIKAANVLVVGAEKPLVKIIDFGLAGFDPRGRIIGTPSYMPPEIASREPADRRADIYSLGVLWYASLARINPFRGASSEETISRQLSFVPPPPSSYKGEIPAWIDAVIMRMLEKNPSNRYASAEGVLRDINRLGPVRYRMETRETLLSYLPDEGRFIGREEEMAILEGQAGEIKAKAEGASARIAVVGEAGTGRSRLLREMKYRLQLADMQVHLASCADAASLDDFCRELSAHLSGGAGMAAFLLDDAEMVSSDDSLSGRIVPLIFASRRPAPGVRLMIVAATRPAKDRGDAMASASDRTIELASFSQRELRAYVSSLTGLSDPPEELIDGIARRTEGNPFFVTWLIRSLIEGGGLFDEHGRWKATLFEDLGVDFSKAVVSETVGDLLIRRVEGLSGEEKRILEALSAWQAPASAQELADWAEVGEASAKIHELARRGLLDRDEEFRFFFHNALMAQTVYGRMPAQRREGLHDRIAESLEEAGAPRAEVLKHRSRGSDGEAACRAALEIGNAAIRQGRAREAAAFLSIARDRANRNDVELVSEIEMKLGEAALIGHDYAAARERFARVEQFVSDNASEGSSAAWRADALTRLGATYIRLQEPGRARVALEDARAALGDTSRAGFRNLIIDNFLAALTLQEGRPGEARGIFERTRAAWIELPPKERSKVNNNDLGMALASMGEIDEAQRVVEDDLARATELGDDLLVARAHYNLAQISLMRGEFGKATLAYKMCAEVCRRSENTELMLRAWNGLGNALHLSGELEQSIAYYERGLSLHERAGDLRGGAAISVNMGIVETARGRYEAAKDRLVPAVEYLRALDQKTAVDWMALARGLLELGDVLHRQGKDDRAREALEEARDISSRVQRAAPLRFWVLATLAEVEISGGRAKQAAELSGMIRPLASRADEKKKVEEIDAAVEAAWPPPDGEEKAGAPWSPEEEGKAMKTAEGRAAPAFKRILEINKLISVESDLDYVLKTVLFYALELSGAEAGAVLLVEDSGGLSVACRRNMAGDDEEAAFSRTLAERAISTGSAVATDNAMEDSRFAEENSVAVHSLRSVLCLPVSARGRVIGALYLDHRMQAGVFAGADMELLEAFADQVGLAIETARLLARGARKEEDLKIELSEASRRVERYEELLKEKAVEEKLDVGPLVGKSSAMAGVLKTLGKISDTDLSVFLCGETGTGKELIAKALHSNHPARRKGRFVAINCGAIPATLIESELFGYKAGAFTGAVRDKRGLVEEADGGTLFLDEVGELEHAMQVKLLRVLQEREFTRVGSTETRSVDVRVIAASNRDIEEMVKEGSFREDLYYRICQMRIDIPPLRERPEDLPLLAARFLKEAAPSRSLTVAPKLMRKLLSYGWPGNVRELENLMQVAAVLSEGDLVDEGALPENHPIARLAPASREPLAQAAAPQAQAVRARSAPEVLARPMVDEANRYDEAKSWGDYERVIIAKCFAANGFNAKAAAEELGISVATLYNRVKDWNLKDGDAEAYSDPFVYTRGRKLEDYLPPVFSAALAAVGGKASVAIANLRVSQGYFYKVMRKGKETGLKA